MGEDNSPRFADGQRHGRRDTMRIASCPPRPPLGYDRELSGALMYWRGFESAYDPYREHVCGQECERSRATS